MRLSKKRALFTKHLAYLIVYARILGFNPAVDATKVHEDDTVHMPNSLHREGLAADIVLYNKDWNYLTHTKHYKQLGEYWESLHENCRWGGRIGESEPGKGDGKDGNHFSMSWDRRI